MKLIFIIVLMIFSQASNADWRLCNIVSKLHFITTQNESLTEAHSFSNMEGTISVEGKVQIKIDLNSVDTNNSLRNLKLQDLFFETSKFQEATISSNLGGDFLSTLEVDKAIETPVQVKLNLHGVTKEIDSTLLVTRLKNNCLIVMSRDPIIISLKDFNFLPGLEKLRQFAKLESISKTVNVSLNLFFRSDEAMGLLHEVRNHTTPKCDTKI